MLAADIEKYRDHLKGKDRDAIIEIAVENYKKFSELEIRLTENEKSSHEMFLEFDSMKTLLASREHEIDELRRQITHLTGINISQTQEMFGRSSEKTKDIRAEALNGTDCADPLDEDAPSDDEEGSDPGRSPGKGKNAGFPRSPSGKSHETLHEAMDKLPRHYYYEYDIDELNKKYGEGNWRFSFWEGYETIEIVRQQTYCKVVLKPIVFSTADLDLHRIPYEGRIIPKSPVSSSLLALLLCERGNMYLPFYRIEKDEDRFGVPISRQTMTNWMIYVAQNHFKPVFNYLAELLKLCPYQQCDETVYNAIMELTHQINYVWTHRTSELYDTNQIILYFFEPSRSAEHLLRFFEGLINHVDLSSDAYGAYYTLEDAFDGLIEICGCFMHVRRRPVDSIRSSQKSLTDEELKQLPEMKLIEYISRLYTVENASKDLSSDERLRLRQTDSKEIIRDLMEYVDTLEENDPQYSDKFKDAIRYIKNHRESLERFLNDGNIPIDNGASERSVKPVASIRKNSMFSYSACGAESIMIVLSLIETAKANKAVPYYYLKYLLEEMSKAVIYGHPYNIEDMVPWSEAYRAYEHDQRFNVSISGIPPENEKPRTPKRADIKTA